jgi:hypothetical protein
MGDCGPFRPVDCLRATRSTPLSITPGLFGKAHPNNRMNLADGTRGRNGG